VFVTTTTTTTTTNTTTAATTTTDSDRFERIQKSVQSFATIESNTMKIFIICTLQQIWLKLIYSTSQGTSYFV
jgi:uncharacterized membrane protein